MVSAYCRGAVLAWLTKVTAETGMTSALSSTVPPLEALILATNPGSAPAPEFTLNLYPTAARVIVSPEPIAAGVAAKLKSAVALAVPEAI